MLTRPPHFGDGRGVRCYGEESDHQGRMARWIRTMVSPRMVASTTTVPNQRQVSSMPTTRVVEMEGIVGKQSHGEQIWKTKWMENEGLPTPPCIERSWLVVARVGRTRRCLRPCNRPSSIHMLLDVRLEFDRFHVVLIDAFSSTIYVFIPHLQCKGKQRDQRTLASSIPLAASQMVPPVSSIPRTVETSISSIDIFWNIDVRGSTSLPPIVTITCWFPPIGTDRRTTKRTRRFVQQHVVHVGKRTRVQTRIRRCSKCTSRSQGQERKVAEVGVGNHRHHQRSLFHAKSPRYLRMQTVPHTAHERRKLSGAHARKKTPTEPCQKSRPGTERKRNCTRRRTKSDGQKKPQTRTTRIQSDQTIQPREQAEVLALSTRFPGNRSKHPTQAQDHVFFRTKDRASGSKVSVYRICSTAVRDHCIQNSKPRIGKGKRQRGLFLALESRYQTVLRADHVQAWSEAAFP